jgi:2-octaprenylphenol hydroxylase
VSGPANDCDVLIVGGGMVGAALACALGDTSLRVCVVEAGREPPQPASDYDLRVSAVTLGSQAMLHALGVWDAISAHRLAPIRGMHVWDQGGSGQVHFDSAELGTPALGYIVENGIISHSLVERMRRFANIDYRSTSSWDSLELGGDHARLRLQDGKRLRAALVVGADGASSAVRRQAGIDAPGSPFGQKAIVAVVRSRGRHDFVARQRFLATGPLAFLPLDEPHTCSIVWSADNARADQLLALDSAAFLAALQEALGDCLGPLEHVGERAAFPLTSAHAQSYIGERVVLVGDAAHRVHPLAGQGLNLGLADVAVLSEVLVDALERKQDIGARATLRRYERWRRGDNALMVAAMEGFHSVFTSGTPALRAVRNVGLDLVDQLSPVKQRIMRFAAGLAGERPRLLRGLPLASRSE